MNILSLLLVLVPSAPAAPPAAAALEYVCDGGHFTAMIPSGWQKEDDVLVGRREKQYGVDLYAPDRGQDPASTISLIYFGPDHARFKTPEKYIKMQLETRDRVPGETAGKVKDTVVSHRYSRTLDKRSYDLVPPYSVEQRKVEMFERLVVMPAKGGFYVLSFKAPKNKAARLLPVFEKILKTFKPAH